MTTAEALEGMTDPGKFEILATRVLRGIDPDCEAIAHAGVNAQGKTIPNPIDAFCRVPASDPPRYVMAAFTLAAADGLKAKWLFDHTAYTPTPQRKTPPPTAADDGDLIKAGNEAAAIRARHPTAEFVVWLCTNRRLDNDVQQPVHDRAAALGVEVRFLEQSQMRDFLDVRPGGQWLRQEHLGIQADQVSAPLLRKLSRDSLDRYATELLLPPADQLVPTRAAGAAFEALQGERSLHLLIGPSGAGKSVIAHDLLRRHTEAGGIGLWIPGEVADREASLSGAVDVVLRSLHPRLGPGAGHEILRPGIADRPLLLVVDDVNRSPDPIRLLRKVAGWSRPGSVSDGAAAGVTRSSLRLVCPLWDAWWHPLRHTFESTGCVRAQSVGPMTRPEAVACLKAALRGQPGAHTDTELAGFAERLHDDPILLGLFGRLLTADPSANPLAVCDNVIGKVVEQAVGELAAAKQTLAADYTTALDRLTEEMIRRRSLHPRWAEVEGWFGSQPALRDRLAQLAAQGHVCRLAETVGPPRFEFRHDRILEYHLSQAAARMLPTAGDDREAVMDPFFTPFVGRAIARSHLPGTVLDWVRQQNPPALVAAVPYLTSSASTYADEVVRLAGEWLRQPGGSPDAMRYDAYWTLARTSSPRIHPVTEGVRGNRSVWEARLRNGDAASGALALSGRFYPAMRYSWLESLIEEARTHHGPRLTNQLHHLLRSPDLSDRERFCALCLAGYLADPALANAVKFAWENAPDGRAFLLPALWAGIRCAGDTPAELLGPMMPYILLLQHDESGKKVNERYSILRELKFASRHGVGDSVLSYLTNLGVSQERFRWIVASILDDLDHPLAVRYVVRLLAETKHKAEQAGGFPPWAHMWGDNWNLEESGKKNCLSAASVSALKSLWEAAANPDWLKDYAFTQWARHVRDLAELQAVAPGSRHYESAVWQRALRGDRTVSGYVIGKVVSDEHWLRLIPSIWAAEFEPVVDVELGKIAADPEARAKGWSNHHFDLGHLIRDIPAEAAERLLARHWVGLGRCPLFIQAALYHDTPRCRDLASSSLASTEPGDDPLKHLDSFFGFFIQGLMDRLTRGHLDCLLPHLTRLDDGCLVGMLEYCRRFQHWDWAVTHLEPEMKRRAEASTPYSDGAPPRITRKACRWFPTDGELFAELDEIERIDARYRVGHLVRWWDDFIERDDPDNRVGRLLSEWFVRNPSPARFVAAVEILTERGKRHHLDALLRLKPPGDHPEVNRAAANAAYAVRRRSLD